MKAKKSLGQNFLIDNNVIQKIVDNVSATNKDLIIEIGPGKGALTKKLKNRKALLIAYEIDDDLISELKLLEDDKTRIINKDILAVNIKDDIKNLDFENLYIVGNLPYYITTPIVEGILRQSLNFKSFTIMVQKEVAERFMASPGTKEYGYFTLFLKYFVDIKKICEVSKNSFVPAPKVESCVISLIPKSEIIDLNQERYFDFLKECFKQKRKTLKNNLSRYEWAKIKNILEKHNLSESIRAEQLTQEQFIEIFRSIYD